jgi:hypothetical protein
MLASIPKPDPYAPPIPETEETFDWGGRLSLDMIRQHTKTGDTVTVTDEQLILYRAAAIEAAQLYTGFLLTGQRTVTEPIQGPPRSRPGKWTYKYTLKYPVADGMVYLYGAARHTFMVPPGSRVIDVPIRTGYLDLSNCCDPCSSHFMNAGMMAAYLAGFSSPAAVPTSVVLGCLQYIAWVVEHPGDELLTMRNKEMSFSSTGIQGSNNIALVSGALETWRVFELEA